MKKITNLNYLPVETEGANIKSHHNRNPVYRCWLADACFIFAYIVLTRVDNRSIIASRGDKLKDVNINIRLPAELRDKLNEVCDRKRIKKSELIRDKIKEIIKENEK